MIEIQNENQCCGCGACAASCPQKCISMIPLTLGALFPIVDNNKCLHCNLCDTVCPIKNVDTLAIKKDTKQQAFAAYAEDETVRFNGSSGGIFQTLATHLLDVGFEVYGAAFDKQLNLHCVGVTRKQDLLPLCKSKYLQSNLIDKFKEISDHLNAGISILFVATPCQVAALKLFLKRDYDNLITVDFFCLGVPSQKFFNECTEYEDNKYARKTISYEFRTKVKGGVTPHYFTIVTEKNEKKNISTYIYFKSIFYAAFQQNVTLRESCYTCVFANRNRFSDITIGDFHEINKYVPIIDRYKGISTVIINTSKGLSLWNVISSSLSVYPMSLERLITDKVCFAGPTNRPNHRDAFISCYNIGGIKSLDKKYLNQNKYIRHKIYYLLPEFIRQQIKEKFKLS